MWSLTIRNIFSNQKSNLFKPGGYVVVLNPPLPFNYYYLFIDYCFLQITANCQVGFSDICLSNITNYSTHHQQANYNVFCVIHWTSSLSQSFINTETILEIIINVCVFVVNPRLRRLMFVRPPGHLFWNILDRINKCLNRKMINVTVRDEAIYTREM